MLAVANHANALLLAIELELAQSTESRVNIIAPKHSYRPISTGSNMQHIARVGPSITHEGSTHD